MDYQNGAEVALPNPLEIISGDSDEDWFMSAKPNKPQATLWHIATPLEKTCIGIIVVFIGFALGYIYYQIKPLELAIFSLADCRSFHLSYGSTIEKYF
jgi:hypothetical protein